MPETVVEIIVRNGIGRSDVTQYLRFRHVCHALPMLVKPAPAAAGLRYDVAVLAVEYMPYLTFTDGGVQWDDAVIALPEQVDVLPCA